MTERDLDGRTVLVTGATSGVGLAAVRGLVARGANVLGASRSGAQGEATSGIALDLTDPASILRASAALVGTLPKLDGLVHGAGGIYWEPKPTGFGIDRSWAVNYLGHVLLTRELWPLLEAAPRGRVATVAGNPRFVRPGAFDPASVERTPRSALEGAGQAMTARVLWMHTLAKRTAGTRITVLAFHPGLVRSKLVHEGPLVFRAAARVVNGLASPTCEIAVRAAVDPELAAHNGALLDPSGAAHRFPALEARGDALSTITERRIARVLDVLAKTRA